MAHHGGESTVILTTMLSNYAYPLHAFHKIKYICRSYRETTTPSAMFCPMPSKECSLKTDASKTSIENTTATSLKSAKEPANEGHAKEAVINGKIYEFYGMLHKAVECYTKALKAVPTNERIEKKIVELRAKMPAI